MNISPVLKAPQMPHRPLTVSKVIRTVTSIFILFLATTSAYSPHERLLVPQNCKQIGLQVLCDVKEANLDQQQMVRNLIAEHISEWESQIPALEQRKAELMLQKRELGSLYRDLENVKEELDGLQKEVEPFHSAFTKLATKVQKVKALIGKQQDLITGALERFKNRRKDEL